VTSLRKTWTIARGNIFGPMLDPAAGVLMFVVPVVIIGILGLILSRPQQVPIGVVGSGGISERIIEEIDRADAADVRVYDTAEDLRDALRRQDVAAGVVVPDDAERELRAGRSIDISLLVDPERPYPVAARSIVLGATDRIGTVYRAARFAERDDGDFEAALRFAEAEPNQTEVVREQSRTTDALTTAGFDYAAPATVFFFMFLNTLTFAGGLVVARQLGCLRRIAATPTRPATVLVGDFFGRFVLAVLQGLLIVAVGSLAFGVSWGNVGGVLALVALFAAVSVGAAELLGSVARTREQVLAVAAPTGLLLGMLGGCIWPLSIVGPFLRDLAKVVPHSWAVSAAQKLQYGLPLRSVTGSLAMLGVFAVVLAVAAHARLAARLRSV
jgi:ABC-2 type transport system permease protein